VKEQTAARWTLTARLNKDNGEQLIKTLPCGSRLGILELGKNTERLLAEMRTMGQRRHRRRPGHRGHGAYACSRCGHEGKPHDAAAVARSPNSSTTAPAASIRVWSPSQSNSAAWTSRSQV
jgi:hypothetical protein